MTAGAAAVTAVRCIVLVGAALCQSAVPLELTDAGVVCVRAHEIRNVRHGAM